MLRRLLLTLAAAAATVTAQPTLEIEPAVATLCNAGGQTTLRLAWRATGATRILIETPTGRVAMTGLNTGDGRAPTGPWVTDGMTFLLADESGRELARARARVLCWQPAPASWLPLQTGYNWTYRTRSRFQTGDTVTWRVTRAGEADSALWFEIEQRTAAAVGSIGWFREDESGRILRRTTLTAPAAPWLEPSPTGPAATYKAVTMPFASESLLGTLPAAIRAEQREALTLTRVLFGAGAGLIELSSQLLTGSSGGFLEGWDLVAYEMGGLRREEDFAQSLALKTEAAIFDVTNRRATNCAVPCYFLACGLAPGADPPGTYKPCFRAAAEARHAVDGATIELRLAGENGAVHYQAAGPLSGQNRLQRQIPLPTPPGRYTLTGRIVHGSHSIATAATEITVE